MSREPISIDVPGARLAADDHGDPSAPPIVLVPNAAHSVGMEVPNEHAALIVELLAPLPRWA